MGILYTRLLIVLNDRDLYSTDYHIALVMLQNMQRLAELSIQELAGLCNVSKSTISKFIRELGYEDFADFRSAAIFEDNKYHNSFNFVQDVMGFLEEHPTDSYFLEILRDMQESYASLDWSAGDFVRKSDFDDTKGKVVLITSNPEAARDPRVAYSVLYRRTGTLHTHRMVYQLLTDLIAYRYRVYQKKHNES